LKAAKYTANDMQGFKAAYIQSDEVTFCLTDYDTFETDGWFGYKISKVVSISAALMSVAFNKLFYPTIPQVFDSRAFTVPKEEVVNTFLWRAKDWARNSLQMYARMFFSHSELHKKNSSDIHEMLHEVGSNWTTDLTSQERNGTFLIRENGVLKIRTDIIPSYSSMEWD
jgi:tRNA(His) 5'-end guanylyltransferase